MAPHAHRHGDSQGFEGRHSRWYDFMAGRLLRRMYRRLARDVAPLAADGATVLDVGTGPGVLVEELARLRPDLRLTGLDLSADMVAAARRRLARFGARAEAVTGDVADLPFADRSYDLVVSSLSMHHWSRPADAIGELARVLRPDGLLCVYDLPTAPFEELTVAGRVVSRSAIRGIPFTPRLTRLVLALGPTQ